MTGRIAVCIERDVCARIVAFRVPMSAFRPNGKTTNIEGPRTYIASKLSLFKLFGKCTPIAATVSGSKVNCNPRRDETNRVAHNG